MHHAGSGLFLVSNHIVVRTAPVAEWDADGRQSDRLDFVKGCSEVACTSLHIAGGDPRALEVSVHEFWSCNESRGAHRHMVSTHRPQPSPDSRSDAAGNDKEEYNARVLHRKLREHSVSQGWAT